MNTKRSTSAGSSKPTRIGRPSTVRTARTSDLTPEVRQQVLGLVASGPKRRRAFQIAQTFNAPGEQRSHLRITTAQVRKILAEAGVPEPAPTYRLNSEHVVRTPLALIKEEAERAYSDPLLAKLVTALWSVNLCDGGLTAESAVCELYPGATMDEMRRLAARAHAEGLGCAETSRNVLRQARKRFAAVQDQAARCS